MFQATAAWGIASAHRKMVPPLVLIWFWVLTSFVAQAQAPAWQTLAGVIGTTSGAYANVTATATDANGNVYVCGNFSGTILLGDQPLTSGGRGDIFIAKWNRASERFLWSQQISGAYGETAVGLAVMGTSVYIVGNSDGASISLGPLRLTNQGVYDGFIAKLTDLESSATFTWAESIGQEGFDRISGLAVNGNMLYVSGYFQSAAIKFGSIVLANTSTEPFMGVLRGDSFVTKITDTGPAATFVWAQQFRSLRDEEAMAIAVQGANVYVAGSFIGTTDFGGITLTAAGFEDGFVCKLVDAGASCRTEWVQRAGGVDVDTFEKLVVNGTSIYLAGAFTGPATFGSILLTSTFRGASFIAKLLDAGTSSSFIWAQEVPARPTVLTAAGNSLYVGNGTSSGVSPLVTKFTDTNGGAQPAWTVSVGVGELATAFSLCRMGTSLYVAGITQTPVKFGERTFALPAERKVGFLASLTDSVIPLAANAATTLAGVSLYPNPAQESMIVELPALRGTTQATLTLVDARGRVVRVQSTRIGATTQVSTLGLAPGLYQARVQAGDRYSVHSLVIN